MNQKDTYLSDFLVHYKYYYFFPNLWVFFAQNKKYTYLNFLGSKFNDSIFRKFIIFFTITQESLILNLKTSFFNFKIKNIIPLKKYRFFQLQTIASMLGLRFSCHLTFFKNFLFLLYKNSLFYYKILIDIASIEFYSKKTKKTQLYLSYHFLSLLKNKRLMVKVFFNNTLEFIPSLSNFYINANWYEREIWDLFGIFFIAHIDLRRILTDYGFFGFPLTKSFPLIGYLELKYEDDLLRIIYEPNELNQNFRYFDFMSSWDRS